MSPSKPAKRVQTAYLGLGGNLGDRHALLSEALTRLASAPGVRVTRISPVYETRAVGPAGQPDYLNIVVELSTTLTPDALLTLCLSIEEKLGRVRRERWGARTIDLDVLTFGEWKIDDDTRLTLPHPRLHERAFVLAPFADLAPEILIREEPIHVHLSRVDRNGVHVRPDLALGLPVLVESITLPSAPHEFFARVQDHNHAFFLDSGLSSGGLGAYSFIGFNPFLSFRAKNGTVTITRSGEETETLTNAGHALDELQRLLRRYATGPSVVVNALSPENSGAATASTPAKEIAPASLPFTGGAVGFFGYELCTQLENLPRVRTDDLTAVPDCEFGFYDAFIAHEHATNRSWLVANPVADRDAATLLAELRDEVENAKLPATVDTPTNSPQTALGDRRPPSALTATEPVSNFDYAAYENAISRIKAYIASGDVYQVNLTQRFTTPLPCEPYALYQRLRARSPAPFATYLSFGDVQLVSSSPERFLTLRGRRIETRPIKGTRPRSDNPAKDAALAHELQTSEKDRAELLMIVDLERNDLGRVCDYGSVHVEKLWQLESHPTVHHLVATVSGMLRSDLDIIDCVRASFPGGSITGAPKIRSMEIIDELEPHRRHIYTGAIGYLGFDGNADLNIAIRTITCVDQDAYYHVGGGIVWDSVASAEYQETLDKGRAMHAALTQAN